MEKKEFSTYLAKVNDAYLPMIERQMEDNQIVFSDYSKRCVMNALGTINQMLDKQGLNFNSPELDQSNLTTTLLNVAHLEVNSIAQPSECYFQIRNVKMSDGKYKKQIEFNLQGDGFDAILSRFGRDVKKVYPHWLVREGDHFEYPKYNGLQYSPPIWEPRGTGEVVRIVYPILHTDDTLHFYIGERDDVLKNLMAHINNNMMNETFGIAENRYKASKDQLVKIDARKSALKAKAKSLGWGVLDDEELAPFISPSWKEDFSRESMIIRKMRNNVVKKIPKDFGSPAVLESYSESTDDGYARNKQLIDRETGAITIEPIGSPENAGGSQGEIIGGDIREGGENETPLREAQESSGGADVDSRPRPNFN